MPLTPSEVETLARAWVEYTERSWNDEQQNEWAYGKLLDLLATSHQVAWPVVLKIIDLAKSDYVMGMIAAGPLEDLLSGYGDKHFDLVKDQAEKNSNFRRCLRKVAIARIAGPASARVEALVTELHERDSFSD